MPSQNLTISAANGESLTFSITNIAAVQDRGDSPWVDFVQPIVVTVGAETTSVKSCEIVGKGVLSFRSWMAEHNR